MKWKNVGDGIYESDEWVIENQKTMLNPHQGWAVYEKRAFLQRTGTLTDAKLLVAKLLARRKTLKTSLTLNTPET